MLNLTHAWMKAAVEHRVIELVYHSGKRVITREFEPDFLGVAKDGMTSGRWGRFSDERQAGFRNFDPDKLLGYHSTEKTFKPPKNGRWKELVGAYKYLKLDEKALL